MVANDDSRWQRGKQQFRALLWRQWLVKSRTPITTLVEVLSPILLMSIVVYAYSLVEPELRPQRIYANRTSELVYNLSRDAARSQLASDLRLCAAILQPLPGGGGPAQQPAMQQGAGGRNPAQTGAGRPEEGSIVPPGRRRLRQETPRQTGGADPGFVPDFQAGGGTQDPAYLEWAAMHSGAAGGFEAASADVSDAADGAAGSAEAASAGGGDAAVADAGAEALPAGVSDSLTSTTGVAGRAGEDGAVDVVGGEPAAVSSALDSIPEPSAGTGDQDAAYLEWAAMQSGTAAGATTPAAVGDSPDGAGAADIMPDLLAHAEGPSGASKFPGAARPEAGNGVQDPAYLAWLAMTGGAAANGSPASAVTATVGMPMAAPALAPATDGVSVAPSPQHLAEAGLQDPAYLAWLAMTSKAAADASSPAAAAAPGAPLAAEATLDDVSSPLQGFPSQSTSSGDAQSPAADAPAVAAVQTSAAAVPAQSSLVPDPGDQGVDWAQFLTPSVLAAALQLAQNPFDPATWQRLLQSELGQQIVAQALSDTGSTSEQQSKFQECVQDAMIGGNTGAPQLATQLLQGFLNTKGPLPIPTFDEFVLLHKAIIGAVSSDPAALNALHGARRSFGWNMLGNLLDLGKIIFAPATPEVLRLASYMESAHEFFAESFEGVFATEAEAERFALASQQRLWALVVFHEGPSHTGTTDYTIRMNYTTVPPTWVKVDRWKHSVRKDYKEYYSSGFLSIQNAIDGYVMSLGADVEGRLGPLETAPPSLNTTQPPVAGATQRAWAEWGAVFPVAAYHHNRFYDAIGPMLGLLMAMSLVFPLSMLVRGVVEEKENRARETMCIMGLQPWALNAAWAATYATILAIVSLTVAIVCKLSFLPRTDPSLLVTALLLFSAAELAFGLMVAAACSRAKIAAIVAPVLHLASLMPRYIFFRTGEPQAIAGKYAVSVLAPTAFTFFADLLAQYEGVGSGATWADAFSDPLPIAAILFMLTFDTALYSFIAWYLEKVLPSQWGPRLPWWFILSKTWWRTGAAKPPTQIEGPWWKRAMPWLTADAEYERLEITDNAATPDLEAHGTDDKAAVRVRGVRKNYGKTQAVRGVDMQLQLGRITALLGHNGAGKSTLVSIITGMVHPSAGDCEILGHSVRHDVAAARQSLGICPQQNVLFGTLTVEEHLVLYAHIKDGLGGGTTVEVRAAVEEMLAAVGLADKRLCPAAALSGGMKRKLQVAIALLGGSKVVLLDEPSSGMDPVSRQGLWQLLRRQRQAAVLLTTHFMDEADLLSDDVYVLDGGAVACHGSSLQLKEQYGDGYTLTLATAVDRPVSRDAIHDLIVQHVPSSARVRAVGGELVYRLPLSHIAYFPDLLEALEAQADVLGLQHFGLAMPTLEEIFLRVTTAGGATPDADPAAANGVSQANGHTSPATSGTESVAGMDSSGGGKQTNGPAEQQSSGANANSNTLDIRDVSATLQNLPATTNGHASGHANGHAIESSSEPAGNGYTDKHSHSKVMPAANGLHSQRQKPSPKLPEAPSWARASRAAAARLTEQRRPGSRALVAFREMFRKRALIASRDKKGAVFTLLLPVIAVAFVLSILKVNIDPTSPSLLVTLQTMDQRSALPTANVPAALEACVYLDGGPNNKGYGKSGLCGHAGVSLRPKPALVNSVNMSMQLLQDIANGFPPQYGALVFNDDVGSEIARAAFGGFGAVYNASALDLHGGQAADVVYSLLGATPQGRVALGFAQRMASPAVTLMHNGSSFHALPALLSDLHGALAGVANGTEPRAGPRLITRNHPLPLTEAESIQLDFILMVLAAVFVLIPFCYLSGAYAISPVVERASSAQHLQLASGCPPAAYWAGSFAWDMVSHLAVTLLSLAIFAAYGDEATIGSFDQALGTFTLLMAYGAAVIPLAYAFAFGFSSHSAAQVAIAGINFVCGFILVIGSYVMEGLEETRDMQKWLVHVFRCVPPFNLGEGLIELSKYNVEHNLAGTAGTAAARAGVHLQSTVFEWKVLGRSITLMLIECVIMFALVLALQRASADSDPWRSLARLVQRRVSRVVAELRLMLGIKGGRGAPDHRQLPSSDVEMISGVGAAVNGHAEERQQAPSDAAVYSLEDEDEDDDTDLVVGPEILSDDTQVVEDPDVTAERQRVLQAGAAGGRRDIISITNLRKQYDNNSGKAALEDLCLGIPRGQRFGFLGPNGAGKTTTLSILAGRQTATAGAALIAGVPAGSAEARRQLGYCPQVDPLLDLLTGQEHLAMYARLKGVPEAVLRSQVIDALQRVGMPAEMSRRPAGGYSGGNKRKLSLAIALVGSPGAVLLDEPSSGMDPGARRMMWSSILAATAPAAERDALATAAADWRQTAGTAWTAASAKAVAGAGGPESGHAILAATASGSGGADATSAASAVELTHMNGDGSSDEEKVEEGDDPEAGLLTHASGPDRARGADVGEDGCAVVLTTHSMEEVEVLCSRVGIMHRGRLACLGSPQHLKALYGGGYLLEVIAPDETAVHAAIGRFAAAELGAAPVEGSQLGRSQFRLAPDGPSLSAVFRALESVKDRLQIEAYSLSQPTLEQVFLNVIGDQLSTDTASI